MITDKSNVYTNLPMRSKIKLKITGIEQDAWEDIKDQLDGGPNGPPIKNNHKTIKRSKN